MLDKKLGSLKCKFYYKFTFEFSSNDYYGYSFKNRKRIFLRQK